MGVGTEERIRLVAETAHAFTACTDNLDELLVAVARHTSETIGSYCGVLLMSEDRQMLRPVALHDPDPEMLARMRRILSTPFKVQDVPALVEILEAGRLMELPGMSPAVLQARFPDERDQAEVVSLRLHNILYVPLRARATLLGMMVLVRHGTTTAPFSDNDKQMARSLADLAALALFNAQLLQATRAQADERRQLTQHLSRLTELARDFAKATADPQRLYDAIASAVREQSGDLAVVRLVSEDREWLETAGAISHADPAFAEEIRRVLFSGRMRVTDWVGGSVVATALPKRAGPVPPDILMATFPPPLRPIFERLQPTSFMVVPLVSHDGVVGVLGLARRGPAFSDSNLAIHQRIAAHAAEAVSNARLLERCNRELVARQRVVGHQRLLSELSRQFAAATEDFDLLLDTLASRLYEVVGDACVIRLLTPDGSAFEDREWTATSLDIPEQWRTALPQTPDKVATTGETLLVERVANASGMQSVLACALRARGRVVGVITLLRTRSGQPYGIEDRRLVEDVAVHAGLALSNSRLLLERQAEIGARERLAEQLQHVSGLAREFAAATSDSRLLKELIARRIGELLGDLCVLRTIAPGAELFDTYGGCYHPDPVLQEHAMRTMVSTVLRFGEGIGGRVAASGKPIRVALDAAQIAALTDSKYQAFVRAMDLTSIICVPLVVAGQIAGVLSVGRGSGALAYTDADVATVEDLAAHASLAIGNSRLLAAAKAELVERVRNEEELRRGFLEAAPDAVLIVDANDRVTLVNTRAEALFGHARGDLLGMTWSNLVPPTAPQDLVGVRKDRSTFAAEVTRSPIATTDGALVALAVRDVTERRHEYEERSRRVQEASRLKSEFLANMSHELRTPLNAIIGFSSLIHQGKAGPVSETHREYLGDILASSRHLLQLINDVLDLSKIEAGRLEPHVERVDLAKLATEVQNIVRGLLAEHRVKLSVDIRGELDDVELDPRLIKQVLYNYLSNAIKFTPEGGRVTLLITTPDTEHVRIAVTDTGAGIKREDLGRLFTEFQQLDSAGSQRSKGTGLGLALTKRIVEAQGGSVAVHSEVGSGSTFTATVPKRAVQGQAAR